MGRGVECVALWDRGNDMACVLRNLFFGRPALGGLTSKCNAQIRGRMYKLCQKKLKLVKVKIDSLEKETRIYLQMDLSSWTGLDMPKVKLFTRFRTFQV